jgi:TonB-linked SusC/RagA family outer membrane protein
MKKKRNVMSSLKMDKDEILLRMKLLTLLIFAAFVSASASSYSRSLKFNLNMKDERISDVFQKIEEQSEFINLFNEISNIETSDIKNIEVQQPQKKNISGTVKDNKGISLPGVNVVVKGTTIGTITDNNGKFMLSLPVDATMIIFSFVGMKTQEFAITGKTTFAVVLEDEKVGMEEVVVVGYGIQRKVSVLGAITQVDNDVLVKSGSSNITNTIAGKLSGVLTIQQTGEPGNDDSEIIIRGLSSWNGSQPLVLVDGVERDFKNLDPNEIKTVSVLKDASATAVFGAKGANGVIIVTTQRGIVGKAKMNFSGSVGIEKASRIPDQIDSYKTMSMLNVAYMNQRNFAGLIPATALSEYQNPSTPLNSLRYPNVDWFELTTKSVAPTTNANFNITGGNNWVKYFCSLGHLYQSDFFKNSNSGDLDSRYWYHRLNYRANLDFNLTKTTQFSFNMGGDVSIKNQPSSFTWRSLYAASGAMYPAYFPEWVLGKVPDPDYPNASGSRLSQAFGGYVDNPYSNMIDGSFNRYLSSKLFTDIVLDQKLDFITKGLSFSSKASLSTYYRNNSLTASYAYPEYLLDYSKIGVDTNRDGVVDDNPWYRAGEGNEVYVLPPVNISTGGLQSDYYRDLYYEAGLNYNRNFENHSVTGLLLANRQQKNEGTDFPYYNQGFVGRATYNYKLKYLLELNIGYTGSERFAPGNRYGFFPSGAIGWVISEEKIVKNSVPWMNKLKIRYSDGKVGSDIAANRWLYISDYYTKSGYINEDKGANINAQWEEARKRDIGVEIGVFNCFNINVDLFSEDRDKMLLTPRTTTFIVGNTFKELNIGSLKKHGIEVEAEFNKKTAFKFNYFIKAIFGFNENRVIYKDDLPYAPEYSKSAGKPIDAQLNGTSLTGTGYFTSINDIHINPSAISLEQLVLGDYKYLDYNVDGTVSMLDKHAIEGSLYPPITYSLSAGFSWKNFDFRVMFQGNEGKYVSYDMSFEYEFTKGDYRVHSSQLDYWTPVNQDANHQTLHYDILSLANVAWGGGSGDQGYKLGIPGRTWRDASYLRFKEIYMGYKFSSRFLKTLIGISNLQVYASGNNLFTWTPLIEGDPERKDFQYGFYPQMRRYTVGLSFLF